MPKFYITTPVYYVNAKPHIGHSYTQIACDVIARFMRSAGYDVVFMTGTDEHGEKIEKSTLERGFKLGEEKRFVDEIVPAFKELWTRLDIKYDRFIRTTDDHHVRTVQAFLAGLYKDGKIYKKVYRGWFCTPCETFWSESQSVEGLCPECKRPVEKLDEANYFFKMSDYQGWLIDYIKSHPDFIRPDFRRNEVLGFLNEPLTDLCISRPKSRLSWGIELPFDRDFVAYVWFDALINYISGIGYPDEKETFTRYWPADFHMIGKDILRHHAVYWPIMLHAAGIEPPRSIFAHGWWIMKGEKISKSKGNAVDPLELVDRYGIDPFRYFLLREVSFGVDGSFSEEALVLRYNSDLANDLGNLLNRSLTMAEKYFSGVVPLAEEVYPPQGAVLREKSAALIGDLDGHMKRLDFSGALVKIWEVIGLANKYIEEVKPWTLSKEGRVKELACVIYDLLESLRVVALAIRPFMPQTAISMYRQLGLGEISDKSHSGDVSSPARLCVGTKVAKEGPLFPRIETV